MTLTKAESGSFRSGNCLSWKIRIPLHCETAVCDNTRNTKWILRKIKSMIPKTRMVFIPEICYKTSLKAEVNSSSYPQLKKVLFLNEITKMLVCLKTVTQISIFFINMYMYFYFKTVQWINGIDAWNRFLTRWGKISRVHPLRWHI